MMKSKNPSALYYSLESERLSFRPFDAEDVLSWAAFFIDNPTQRFVAGEKLGKTPIEKASTWLNKQNERKANNEFGQLAIVEKASGKFIGLGGIISRDLLGVDDYEITYSLLPSHWGKGYATELATFFKQYALQNIDTSSVISIIHKENEASMNVAKKNGMIIDGESDYLGMPVYIFRTSI